MPIRRSWFPAAISAFLLIIVFVGFAPSFFFRPAFARQPLPFYLILHGILLTLWFILLLIQAVLVSTRRIQWHRRLGIAAAINAALLVPVSALVTLKAIPRFETAGLPANQIQALILGNLISLILFTGLVASALVWRNHREWHRRLMLFASIVTIGPAIARLEQLPFPLPLDAMQLGLLFSVAIHDAFQDRHLHRATLICTLLILISIGGLITLVGTPNAQSAIDWLKPS